ncbi:MAG: hypothetical protein N2749_00205 [Clostridia bacterium]|nr:hypothetical protein [Clostridia bacterium]
MRYSNKDSLDNFLDREDRDLIIAILIVMTCTITLIVINVYHILKMFSDDWASKYVFFGYHTIAYIIMQIFILTRVIYSLYVIHLERKIEFIVLVEKKSPLYKSNPVKKGICYTAYVLALIGVLCFLIEIIVIDQHVISTILNIIYMAVLGYIYDDSKRQVKL